MRTKVWRKPSGLVYTLYEDMLSQPHLLIAGATGSGKSVLINNLMYTALGADPNEVQFILIDPKFTELHQYKKLPHTIGYACEPQDIQIELQRVLSIMDERKRVLQRHNLRKWCTELGPEVYVVIDEYADLVTFKTGKKVMKPIIQRIAQLGRAMGIHLILATQRPTRDIIDGAIKVNLDARVALRCPTLQDSRNILDQKGAECLPKYGQAYYVNPDRMYPDLVTINMIDESRLNNRIQFWEEQVPRGLFGRR